VIENVQRLPGVRSAALIRSLPFSGNQGWATFTLLDRPTPAQGEEPGALVNTASPGYFRTMGIPLLRGRLLNEQDQADSPPLVLINQTMARRFWPDDNPIGRRIRFSDSGPASIVGVVGDVKHRRLDEDLQFQVYVAYAQNPGIFATLVVRTLVDPVSISDAVRNAVWSIDKDQPLWKIRTVAFLIDQSLSNRHFAMALLGAFAVLALVLTVVGIYGLISYFVNQRTHEMGIRLALGAQPQDILALVLKYGVFLILMGTGAGVVAAFVLTRLMESMLYEVSVTDPAIFIGVSLLLACVALVACYLPARRATKVDPMVALRYE
ncbi:ABC transporter permease, partial [Acidobacteria bacterium AH-259-A15]|nr:ABC transporter permease [Acidobacteria bacterium AH-259-A15]